ncbi:MAG: transcription elongation factor GreA [Ignavibacteria bacterium]|nr:transcription elongation factor GreA [Ignavibacteria bacterium]
MNEQNGNVYLKRGRMNELENELKDLKTIKRKQVADRIAEARSHGDLTENAEYDVAKEEQTHLEIKIAKLENMLARVIVIDDVAMPDNEIHILCNVKLENLTSGNKMFFTLVSPEEADFEMDKISITSPLGKTLLGKKINDTVTLDSPSGKQQFKILEISK